MADAGVHILGLLEDLLGVLGTTLEFKTSSAEQFFYLAKRVLDQLSPEHISPSHFARFQFFSPKWCKIAFGDGSYTLNEALLDDGDILTRIPNILNQQIPNFMDELGGLESSLDDFLNHTIFHSGTDHSSATLPEQQQPSQQFPNYLLSLTKEFKEVITLLHQVTKEAASLHDILRTSLRKLWHSNNHGMGTSLTIVEDQGKQIEDFLTHHFFITGQFDVLVFKKVKHNICLLKEIYQGKFSFAAESSLRSKLQRPPGWLQKYLLCICAGYEVQDTGFKVSQMCSYPETGSSSDVLPQVRGAGKSPLTQEQIVMSLDGDMTCLDGDMTDIVDELTGPEPKLSIVTIAGMGGIGKTTLAKKVFYHKRIVLHFHCLAAVNSLSNIAGALSHLLRSIASSNDEIHGQSIDDKGEILWKSLRKRRYLIVVDDLWNFQAWNAIERFFPDDNLGSRILITSRFVNFPTNIPRNPPHRMRLLNENQSWEILKILVFGEEMCPSELVGVGKQIAGKCGGLPLAIAVIAGILRPATKSLSSWSGVMDSLSDNLEGCLYILALSYKYLPRHLKACFLFMGCFPANSEIDAQKLVHLWSAESFSESISSYYSEKISEGFLEVLINRCLVSVERRSLDGKIKTCSIHDLLRQFCLREAEKRNFMRVFEDDATDRGLRHPRLVFNSKNEASISMLDSHPHLRSFILLTTDFEFSPDSLLSRLSQHSRLRVLDIYFLPLNSFPPAIKYLENLRYLALNITYVLDASISLLSKLQTLVVYGPWIPKVGPELGNLPALYLDFWKMPCLRNVIVRVPSSLCYGDLPPPLRNGSPPPTSELRTLTTIKFSSCTQDVFSLISMLQKLGVSETKEDYENGEYPRCFENLAFLTKLQILKCSFYRGNGESRNLDRGVLPVSLKKLTLRGSFFSWEKMKLLALLPNLETLKLKNFAFQGPEWVLTVAEVFRSLKQLLIDNTDLENWEAADDTNHFPYLKRLVLRSCKSLKEIPFEVFAVIQQIHVHNCSESVENSAKEFQENFESLQVTTGDNTRRVLEKGWQSIEYEDCLDWLNSPAEL